MPVSLLDPAVLSRAGRVDLLVALERHAAWVAALQQEVLAAMAADPGDEPDGSGRDWAREDVSCALRLSGLTAQRRLDVAQTLVRRLPGMLTLVQRGEVVYLHAMTLAEAVDGLDDKACAEIETRTLRRAREQSLAEFRCSVRQAVAFVAAATVEQQRAEAMAQRRVCVSARGDGMAEVWAWLPAEGAAAVRSAIDALVGATLGRRSA